MPPSSQNDPKGEAESSYRPKEQSSSKRELQTPDGETELLYQERRLKRRQSFNHELSAERRAVLETIEEQDRAWQAERDRYNNLTPDERLKEEGEKLQRQIESDPDTLVLLEASASLRARCRAEGDCVHVQNNNRYKNTITTDYRICLDGIKTSQHWARTKYYYHVACFDRMVNLKSLMPAKFKLDPRELWGLIPRKWFEDQGCIDLSKVASFIDAHKKYEEEHHEFGYQWIEWSLQHRKCETDKATCGCPSQPKPPQKPVLEDYITEKEDCCSLEDIMSHPYFGDLIDEKWLYGESIIKLHPEDAGTPAVAQVR